jgi:hypothetical protein
MINKLLLPVVLASSLLFAFSAKADDDDFNPNFVPPRARVAPGLGQDPSELAIKVYGVNPIGLSDGEGDEDRKNFYYTGYFRAPFNFGIGKNQTMDGAGSDSTALHSPPVIPDTSYLDWRYTDLHGGPWTEIKFTYGNRKVSGNVSLSTYNLTTGSYNKLAAQMGITSAFVSLNIPGLLPGGRGGVVANVGVFSARYGSAGRYDAGKYDTYLFGATKLAGEHMRIYYDIAPKLTLHFEQGFGGKVEVAPFMQYELVDLAGNVVNNGDSVVPNPVGGQPWAPYGGSDWPQGDTFVHHEHLGFSYDDKVFVGAHFMHEFSIDKDEFDVGRGSNKNGHLMNMGFDLRIRDYFFGNAYLGYAHTYLKNPLRLGGALEALHSVGGWAWNQNYFKPGYINRGSAGATPLTSLNDEDATGNMHSVAFQYELSLAKLLWHPREFWGQDKDVVITAFGLLNFIRSPSELFNAAETKLKWGVDLLYTPASWLGLGARLDVVNPDMANNTLTFHQYTGKLLFRTHYLANETIYLQYTYYNYGDNVIPGYPWNNDADSGAMKPDNHVITIGANMWW